MIKKVEGRLEMFYQVYIYFRRESLKFRLRTQMLYEGQADNNYQIFRSVI